MEYDDPVTVARLSGQPYYCTWGALCILFEEEHAADRLLPREGVTWIRGHVASDTPEYRALLVARALLRTW